MSHTHAHTVLVLAQIVFHDACKEKNNQKIETESKPKLSLKVRKVANMQSMERHL